MKYFRQFFFNSGNFFCWRNSAYGAAITGSCKHLRTGVNAACSGNGYR